MILQQLKQATKSFHEQVETYLNLCDERLTLARYICILEHFLGFYQPIEQLFQQQHILNRELEQRCKTPWLLQDLSALGVANAHLAELPLCANLPELETFNQALGCMYVLEGATLGGQIITKHIQHVLRLNERSGCAFFHGYGPDTGPMWKAFGELLVTHIADPEAEDVVLFSACETFRLFHRWLVGSENKL